ncbi:hypothetical protein HY497_01270, partial [Candidatus Woesearchaeota archaeon]|nr:hypothetical protein [Candidatus Woesearchaeota archaeon]
MTKHIPHGWRMLDIVAVSLFLAFLLSFALMQPEITGQAVLEQGMVFSAGRSVGLDAPVARLRVSGYIEGNGSARLYLGHRLVIDSSQLQEADGYATFDQLCIETCDAADGASELRAEIEGDVLVVITAFNYTVATIPEADETLPEKITVPDIANLTLPDNGTNITLPTNETIPSNITLSNETNLSIAPENLTLSRPRAQPKIVLKDRFNRAKGEFVIANETNETFTVELHSKPKRGFGAAVAGETSIVMHGVHDTDNLT